MYRNVQTFSGLNRPIHCLNVFVTPVKETCHARIGLSAEPLLKLQSTLPILADFGQIDACLP